MNFRTNTDQKRSHRKFRGKRLRTASFHHLSVVHISKSAKILVIRRIRRAVSTSQSGDGEFVERKTQEMVGFSSVISQINSSESTDPIHIRA